ncbi:MAG: helix-turn-helix domain-containing protein [Sphingomonadales bacterium]|nr:helix-turn-helix domain-containing protein [Sphingomonadales bacterium]
MSTHENRQGRRAADALERRGVDLTPEAIANLLDTKAAAARVGLSPVTMERFRLTGEGPRFAKLGKAVRYRPTDLDAWVAGRLVASTSEEA